MAVGTTGQESSSQEDHVAPSCGGDVIKPHRPECVNGELIAQASSPSQGMEELATGDEADERASLHASSPSIGTGTAEGGTPRSATRSSRRKRRKESKKRASAHIGKAVVEVSQEQRSSVVAAASNKVGRDRGVVQFKGTFEDAIALLAAGYDQAEEDSEGDDKSAASTEVSFPELWCNVVKWEPTDVDHEPFAFGICAQCPGGRDAPADEGTEQEPAWRDESKTLNGESTLVLDTADRADSGPIDGIENDAQDGGGDGSVIGGQACTTSTSEQVTSRSSSQAGGSTIVEAQSSGNKKKNRGWSTDNTKHYVTEQCGCCRTDASIIPNHCVPCVAAGQQPESVCCCATVSASHQLKKQWPPCCLLNRFDEDVESGNLSSFVAKRDLGEYAIVDSGCNVPMVHGDVELQQLRKKSVCFTAANGERQCLSWQGDLVIPCKDNDGNVLEPLIIKNVSVNKGSPLNLLSVSLLTKKGLIFHFEEEDSYLIFNGRKYPMIKHEGLYLIKLDELLTAKERNVVDVAAPSHSDKYVYHNGKGVALTAATMEIWHQRLPMSNAKIKFLVESGAAKGIAVRGRMTEKPCQCKVCRMMNNAKHPMRSHRQREDEVSRIGEAVYCDLIGPFPPSINGYRYCCSFVDKKSRYGVVYFLKRKSDAAVALQKVVKHFESKNIAIGTLITDVAGEFAKASTEKRGGGQHIKEPASKRKRGRSSGGAKRRTARPPSFPKRSSQNGEMETDDTGSVEGENLGISDQLSASFDDKFYQAIDKLGLEHILCPAHVPQSHGVVERFNRTVTKLANTLLFQARLSHLLWPEAFAHASLIRNCFPVKGRGTMSPYEMFTGKKPNLEYIKVWGCDCYKLMDTYPKIPGQSARKRLIYVGEAPDRIGFKVLDPVSMVFSSEFELLFNEGSCLERMNQLNVHDTRRMLAKAGNLHELPLVTEDYGESLTLEQVGREQVTRNIFTSPQALERERLAESTLTKVTEDEAKRKKSVITSRAAGRHCTRSNNRMATNSLRGEGAVHPVAARTERGPCHLTDDSAVSEAEVVANKRIAKSTSNRTTKIAGAKHMLAEGQRWKARQLDTDERVEPKGAGLDDEARQLDSDGRADERVESHVASRGVRRASPLIDESQEAAEFHDERIGDRGREAEHHAASEIMRDEESLAESNKGELGSGIGTPPPADCGDYGEPKNAREGTPPVPSQSAAFLPDDSVIDPALLEQPLGARGLQWSGESKAITPLSLDRILQVEGDEASLIQDTEQFGPLAPDAIREELAKCEFDSKEPMRPIRIKPIGAVEEDTEVFKEFRRAAFEGDFPIRLVEKNPKKEKTKSYARWKKYSSATTLRQIVELSATSKEKAERQRQISRAKEDIVNDCLRGYILFPQHEHHSRVHFVDAASVALVCGCVAASSGGAQTTTTASCQEQNATSSQSGEQKIRDALDHMAKRVRLTQAETLIRNAALGARLLELGEPAMGHIEEFKYSTFNRQIENLWKLERLMSLAESTTKREVAAAAQAVEELMVDNYKTPSSYQEATSDKCPEKEQWLASMKRERDTLIERQTWEMVPRKSIGNRVVIKSKYIYKTKLNMDRTIQFKSRLVIQGFRQQPGVDFSPDDIYAGVCGYSSVRFMLAYATQMNYEISQTDIQAAFLESYLDEPVYMKAPPDMWKNGRPPKDENGDELVCKLKRGLYGLKQAPLLWGRTFKSFLMGRKDGRAPLRPNTQPVDDVGSGEFDATQIKCDNDYDMGFVELTGDSSIYKKELVINGERHTLLISQYVDDCLICSSSSVAREWLMARMTHRFPVNEKSTGVISLDNPGLLLSMNLYYDRARGVLRLDQSTAIELLHRKLGLDERRGRRTLPISPDVDLPKLDAPEVSVNEYLSIIGSCLHISMVSRPDIAYAVGVLARHSSAPGKQHLQAARDLVAYLYNTVEQQIVYTRTGHGGNELNIYERGSPVQEVKRNGGFMNDGNVMLSGTGLGKKRKIDHVSDNADAEMSDRLKDRVPVPVPNEVTHYVDADFGGDKITRRSTSGYIAMMNGGPVSWSSKIQKLAAQSSAESEIYAATDSVKEALHLRLLGQEMAGILESEPVRLHEDNQACIQLAHNLRGSKAAKHYELRLRFLHEQVRDRNVEFVKVNTLDQLADAFTKALPRESFQKFRDMMLSPKPA